MAEKQTLIAVCDNNMKQPALSVTRCNIMKIMKGKEEITGIPGNYIQLTALTMNVTM